MKKNREFYEQLAKKRYDLGSWSNVVDSGFCDDGDINLYSKGYTYYKWGIKPHLDSIGKQNYLDMCSDLDVDSATLMRDLYGVTIDNAYRHCRRENLPLPLNFKRHLFGSMESKYCQQNGEPDNDCAVRSLAGMLNVSYDSSMKTIQDITGTDPCHSGIDIPELKNICDKTGLSFFEGRKLYGRKAILNITGYELYSMIPELAQEQLSLGVYRHIYYVGYGTVFDSRQFYLHNLLMFVVCRRDREQNIIKLFSDRIMTPPDMRSVAYQRWVNRTSWRKLAFDLQMTRRRLKGLIETPEYLQEVRTLIKNWRTKHEFASWFSNREKRIKDLSTRMGIRWSDAFECLMMVAKEHGLEEK